MAAVTPTALDSPGTGEAAGYLHVDGVHKAPLVDQHNDAGSGDARIQNTRVMAFHFTGIDPSGGDTWDFDGGSGAGRTPVIVQTAWRGDTAAALVRATWSGATITFGGAAGPISGTLYVWVV